MIARSNAGPAGDLAVGVVSWGASCDSSYGVLADVAAGSQWIRNATQVGASHLAQRLRCCFRACASPAAAGSHGPSMVARQGAWQAAALWQRRLSSVVLPPCRSGCCWRTQQGASPARPRALIDGSACGSCQHASQGLMPAHQPGAHASTPDTQRAHSVSAAAVNF